MNIPATCRTIWEVRNRCLKSLGFREVRQEQLKQKLVCRGGVLYTKNLKHVTSALVMEKNGVQECNEEIISRFQLNKEMAIGGQRQDHPCYMYSGQTIGKMLPAILGRQGFFLMNLWIWLGDFQTQCCKYELTFFLSCV